MLEENLLFKIHPTLEYKKFHKTGYCEMKRYTRFYDWLRQHHRQLEQLFKKANDYDHTFFSLWAQKRFYYYEYNSYKIDLTQGIRGMMSPGETNGHPVSFRQPGPFQPGRETTGGSFPENGRLPGEI
ncbi:MAG: hypothetical protein HQK83_17465 [Fibrobacteria bacterium]|nr:hypothetical protein [Fibrobacteria bacterium]